MMWGEERSPTSTHDTVDLRPQPIPAYPMAGAKLSVILVPKVRLYTQVQTILRIIAAIPNIVFYSLKCQSNLEESICIYIQM